MADQISNSKVDIGMTIIQEIFGINEKKQISFECQNDLDFMFKKVKKLIQTIFFEVRKTSLFDSKIQQSPHSASQSSSPNEDLCQMMILASTLLPFILQGMRYIGIAL